MRGAAEYRPLGSAIVLATAVTACADLVGAEFEDAHLAAGAGTGGSPPSTASSGAGASTSASASGSGGAGGAGATGGGAVGGAGGAPACPAIYVSPAGDDNSLGCAPDEPMRTIMAAIARASVASPVPAVIVCEGSYDEEVVLGTPVTLLGGHDCSSWTRTSTYGFPVFDVESRTIVGGTASPNALRVTGGAVGPTTSIDGFTFLGAAVGADGTAVRIDGGAAPVFSNNRVRGGGTTSGIEYGSVGLRIDSGATPEILRNDIDGGIGSVHDAGVVGRVGVLVHAARPFLHDNTITGGASAPLPGGGISSVGVLLHDASGLTEAMGSPLLRNDIHGGDGDSSMADWEIASIGVLATGITSMDVVACSIRSGDVLGVALGKRGLRSLASGDVRVLGSRVYGGDIQTHYEPWKGFRCAVEVYWAKTLTVENSMLYGGVADGHDDFDPGSPSFALAVEGVERPVIRHNTMYSGPSTFPAVGTALRLYPGVRRAVIENNVLASAVGWNEPIWSSSCASEGVIESLQNNLLFNTGAYATDNDIESLFGYGDTPGWPCDWWQGIVTIDALEAHLASVCSAATPGECTQMGGILASGNRTLRAKCNDDGGCIPWPSCSPPQGCLDSVIDKWTQPDDGLSTLFLLGWKLQNGTPCAVAGSSLDLTGEVTVDLFGSARTNPPSMGAHELDAPCSQQ